MAIGSTIEDKDAENVTNVIWAEQGVVWAYFGLKDINLKGLDQELHMGSFIWA